MSASELHSDVYNKIKYFNALHYDIPFATGDTSVCGDIFELDEHM